MPPTGDGVSAETFGEVADGGTRLIAVSAVHSPNGYRADLAALSRVAARSGAWFFVDVCQAAGAVPLDSESFAGSGFRPCSIATLSSPATCTTR